MRPDDLDRLSLLGEPRAGVASERLSDTAGTASSVRIIAGAGAAPVAGESPGRPAAESAADSAPKPSVWATGEQRSLFGEILDWMLAPLLLLWPMSIAVTYVVAKSISNAPFDRALDASVTVLSQQVREVNGRVVLSLPVPARDILKADDVDNIYYQVLGLRGELVAGDPELPLPADLEKPTPGTVRFRTEDMRGSEVRIAYTWVETRRPPREPAQPVLVQVGETLEKRAQLANEIIKGVILPQFVILPIAVVLVWFGLTRGLAPLAKLQQRLGERRPDDLSPIDTRAAPEEIAPLVGAFNNLLARLKLSIDTQKRFVADAAHQMRTPLAGMRTQAELALREQDPQEIRRSLQQLVTSTERATHLINQLLSLARTENKTRSAGWRAVDLDRLARDCVQDWVLEAMNHGIDFGFEALERPVPVNGDPTLLHELLSNLIDNALRYTPRGGTVTVRVRVDQYDRLAVLEVEDTGPGIPERERALVFDRFYRVLGTNVDGSGLGLAIVREIAQQHEAELHLDANTHAPAGTGPGCCFSITFHQIPRPETLDDF